MEFFQVLCFVKSAPKGKGPKPTQTSCSLNKKPAAMTSRMFLMLFVGFFLRLVAEALNHFSWKLFTNNPSELSNPVLLCIIKTSFLQQGFLNGLLDLSLAFQVLLTASTYDLLQSYNSYSISNFCIKAFKIKTSDTIS